ncbi:patched domain-containing protein 3 isoform X1 [Myripristis murdjan]|uniref:patched domain-containing protein 3 isoform X1 n=1 Tax=Myripristis murdjan TaxID=586833 RepID=UPI0011762D8A|nr:patched domain-containing protein 3 isoform X1 [Myripristis murdjan]
MPVNMAGCRCRTDCVEKPFSIGYQKFGRFVGKHPWCFFIAPLFLSTVLGSGFYFLEERESNDIEEQFTPTNGPAKLERKFVQENFPLNNSVFSNQRLYTDGVYASFIAVSRSPNIFTDAALQEILSLDKKVRQINITAGHERLTFEGLCARKYNKCIPNKIIDIVNHYGSKIEQTELTFPFFRFGFSHVFLGYSVGGVNVSSTVIKSAKAIRLFYFLKEGNRSITDLWLQEFLRVFPANISLKSIQVTHSTSLSRQVEFEANTKDVIPLFSITYVIAIGFSILSCLRFDCVRNKVWVATFGVLSAGLAVLSSFGMMLYIGVPFVMTVANSPFLIMGIGVDDMFILISCWQQTNVHDRVEDRLADTYKEAAISITITTLTDVLAFYIGLMTPFRSVQSFCLYSSTAILFCYFYSITFFGAFLVLNGMRENSNKHWLTCKEVPHDCPVGRSKWYDLCCVGGTYDRHSGTEEVQPMNHFFKKYYGPALTKPWTKVCVIILYAVYLIISIYGCFQIKEGIDLRNLAADDSYVVRYYDDEKAYFSEYGPNIMVVIRGEFSYWDEKHVSDLESCVEDFKNLSFIEKDIFTSWLKSYKYYGYHTNLNLSVENVFKTNLDTFLRFYSDFKQDVNFTNNSIHASRFFIQTVNISTAIDEMNMLNKLRDTAKRCPVPLMVYHPAFIYHDQYAVIVSNTIQNISVTTAVMLFISLLLIPNPLCSLWVTFSIASVIVGVTGFMALWDVNLDTISMIILVVCIGFSVDFSAHISYAFVSNQRPSANEKAVEALFHLGYPIVQGAVSTILGVVVLSASKNYIFRTFFKIMFLVILFGLIHGITFIPVFLTFFDTSTWGSSKLSEDEKRKPEDQTVSKYQANIRIDDQEKQIYDNHTFLPDTFQICPSETCTSVWTITGNSNHTQSGQICMASTIPMFRVDGQTYEVQMYTPRVNAQLTDITNQSLDSSDQNHVMGNSQPLPNENNIPAMNCSNFAGLRKKAIM